MFPVFILIWYRYSNKYCRECGNIDDDYGDDSIYSCSERNFERLDDEAYYKQHTKNREGIHNDDSATVLTDRFVKWINRPNVFAGFDEYELATQAKGMLLGSNVHGDGRAATTDTRTVDIDARHPRKAIRKTNRSESNRHRGIDNATAGGDWFCDDYDGSGLFWECIPNTQHTPFELCFPEPTLRNRERTKSNAFEVPIASSGSADKQPGLSNSNSI